MELCANYETRVGTGIPKSSSVFSEWARCQSFLILHMTMFKNKTGVYHNNVDYIAVHNLDIFAFVITTLYLYVYIYFIS